MKKLKYVLLAMSIVNRLSFNIDMPFKILFNYEFANIKEKIYILFKNAQCKIIQVFQLDTASKIVCEGGQIFRLINGSFIPDQPLTDSFFFKSVKSDSVKFNAGVISELDSLPANYEIFIINGTKQFQKIFDSQTGDKITNPIRIEYYCSENYEKCCVKVFDQNGNFESLESDDYF